MQGDTLDVLRGFPADCVDVVVTSPPYWGLRDYGCEQQIGLEKHPSEYIAKIAEVSREIMRVLKKTGSYWLNIGDTYFGSGIHNEKTMAKCQERTLNKVNTYEEPESKPWKQIRNRCWLQPKQKLMIPARVAIALQDDGWILRNEIVWHKPNHMPESVTDRFTRSWESVFFFTKTRKYYFNLDIIRKPYPKVTVERCGRRFISNNKVVQGNFDTDKHKRWAKKVTSAYDEKFDGFAEKSEQFGSPRAKNERKILKEGSHHGSSISNRAVYYEDANPKTNSLGANPGDVWRLTTESFKGAHFATFPQKLVRRILKCACPKGGLVLDPFCGSGTALLVAHKMGFDWIGIDLNPMYCKMADKRILAHGKVRLDKYVEMPQPQLCFSQKQSEDLRP